MYLLNYAGEKFDLPTDMFDDISNIIVAWVEVNTGDETLKYVCQDGTRGSFSTYSAYANYYNGEYEIIKSGKWVVDRDAWLSRVTSYDFLERALYD